MGGATGREDGPGAWRGWDLAHLAVLAACGTVLVLLNTRQWFFGDDWAFIVGRGWTVEDLLRPHNEHWMLASAVVLRSLESIVGYANYAVYAAPAVLAHLLAIHLVWRMLRRAGTHPAVALAGSAVPALFALGEENLTFAVNVGFNLSLALGLAHLLLVDDAEGAIGPRDALGSLLAVLGVATSGLSLVLVAAAAAVVALRRRYAAAVVAAGPAALTYLAWYLTSGRPPSGPSPPSAEEVVEYASAILGAAVSWLVGAGLLGTAAALVVLLLAVGASFLRPRAGVLPAVTAAAAVAVALLIGWGRGAGSAGVLPAPRYVYATAILLTPVLAVAVDTLVRRSRAVLALGCVLLAGAAAVGWTNLIAEVGERAALEQRLRERYLVSAQLIRAGEVEPLGDRIDRTWAPDLEWSLLLEFVPEPASSRPGLSRPRAVVTLEAELELGTWWRVTPRPGPPDRPLELAAVTGAAVSERDGCLLIAPEAQPAVLHLPAQAAGRLDLTSDAPGSMWLTAERGGVRTDHPRHLIVGRADRHLYVRLDGAALEIALPPHTVTRVCHVAYGDDLLGPAGAVPS